MSQTNIQIVKAIYSALTCGDLAAATALLDSDVECHQTASLPFGGRYQGAAGFTELYARILPALVHDVQWHVVRCMADGDYVFALVRLTGRERRTNRPLEVSITDLWRIRNGKAFEVHSFYRDTAPLAELGGGVKDLSGHQSGSARKTSCPEDLPPIAM